MSLIEYIKSLPSGQRARTPAGATGQATPAPAAGRAR